MFRVWSCHIEESKNLPRLELLSATTSAVLMGNVIKALESQINISKVRYWLDSKNCSVLGIQPR